MTRGLSDCRQDEHQTVHRESFCRTTSPVHLFTSVPVLANVWNHQNTLQVGIIPALTCFNEVAGEEKKNKTEKNQLFSVFFRRKLSVPCHAFLTFHFPAVHIPRLNYFQARKHV